MARVNVSSTFEDLQECRAVMDTDWQVRSAAVSVIGEHYREDEQSLPLLRDRAVEDESPLPEDPSITYYAREVALEAIAKYWPAHPDTLPLLRERGENDPTEWLRERAKNWQIHLRRRHKRASSLETHRGCV
jgi:HEAT repeat protein